MIVGHAARTRNIRGLLDLLRNKHSIISLGFLHLLDRRRFRLDGLLVRSSGPSHRTIGAGLIPYKRPCVSADCPDAQSVLYRRKYVPERDRARTRVAPQRNLPSALVTAQDEEMPVEQSRREIAQGFGITETEVVCIEREGLDNEWPPL
jgi:hypothetical protein